MKDRTPAPQGFFPFAGTLADISNAIPLFYQVNCFQVTEYTLKLINSIAMSLVLHFHCYKMSPLL